DSRRPRVKAAARTALLRTGPATSRRKRCSETPDIAYLFLIVVRRRLRELTSPAQSGLDRFLTDKAQLGHIQPSHERFDHPTDIGSDESLRPTSPFPCLATDVHHVGGLFT